LFSRFIWNFNESFRWIPAALREAETWHIFYEFCLLIFKEFGVALNLTIGEGGAAEFSFFIEVSTSILKKSLSSDYFFASFSSSMLGTHSLKATYLTLVGALAAFYLAFFAAYAILKLFLIATASPKSLTFAI